MFCRVIFEQGRETVVECRIFFRASPIEPKSRRLWNLVCSIFFVLLLLFMNVYCRQDASGITLRPAAMKR